MEELILLNSGIIIRDVRSRWLRGESVHGGIIATYQWEDYRQYKQQINPQAGGTVDLTLTGDLGDGLAIKRVGTGQYQIYSVDSKYQMIGRKYGFAEYGLTPEQEYEFFEQLFDFAISTLMDKLWE